MKIYLFSFFTFSDLLCVAKAELTFGVKSFSNSFNKSRVLTESLIERGWRYDPTWGYRAVDYIVTRKYEKFNNVQHGEIF